jgi:S1-C subfamily serine protease
VSVRRPPDWLIYAGAVFALATLCMSQKERADAPPAPPPLPGAELALAPESGSLDPAKARPLPATAEEQVAGTAFSVSEAGVWLTARHVVSGCARIAVLVSPGRGVLARAAALDRSSDLAVLTTAGGAPPLPLAPDRRLAHGQLGFHPGYPRGQPGEAASRLLGPYLLPAAGPGGRSVRVLAWAEVGRTDGLKGSLAGLSGAPVLDAAGAVVGVTLAEGPRRGRLYSAPAAAIRTALARAGKKPAAFAQGQPVTTENYGRAADALRRELSVAEVACLN